MIICHYSTILQMVKVICHPMFKTTYSNEDYQIMLEDGLLVIHANYQQGTHFFFMCYFKEYHSQDEWFINLLLIMVVI